jgi:hypothetical protein
MEQVDGGGLRVLSSGSRNLMRPGA